MECIASLAAFWFALITACSLLGNGKRKNKRTPKLKELEEVKRVRNLAVAKSFLYITSILTAALVFIVPSPENFGSFPFSLVKPVFGVLTVTATLLFFFDVADHIGSYKMRKRLWKEHIFMPKKRLEEIELML